MKCDVKCDNSHLLGLASFDFQCDIHIINFKKLGEKNDNIEQVYYYKCLRRLYNLQDSRFNFFLAETLFRK
jgi:hypothetical protein